MYKSVKTASEIKKTGLYLIPNEEYHKGHGLSSSNIKDVLHSPAHYKAANENRKETRAKDFGSALHCAVLEPHLFDDDFVFEPVLGGPKNKKPWKAEWDAFKEANKGNGKIFINPEEAETIKGICSSIDNHSFIPQIIESCDVEVSAYSMVGNKCHKARADLLDKDSGIIWDVKTTLDARKNAFVRTVGKYKYHLSGSFYLDVFKAASGIDFHSFGWIVVEKSPPYAVTTFIATKEMLEVGRKEYEKGLESYYKCCEDDVWPAYAEKIEAISLPNYYSYED